MTRYAVVKHPMQIDIGPEDYRDVPDGATFADLAPEHDGGYVCFLTTLDCLEGTYVSRAHWDHTPPPGSVVTFHRAALGGGNGASRSILTIIAMVVITYFTAGAGLSGWQLTAARAALMVVATAVINGLVPLDATNASGKESPTYSGTFQGNQARLDESIPELFGRNNGFPDYAAQPYSRFRDSDQYLHAVLLVGRGQYTIRRLSIYDTPLDHFTDVTVARIGPGQSTLDGMGFGYETLEDYRDATPAANLVRTNVITAPEVQSQEMKQNVLVGPIVAVPAERECVSLGVDVMLPRGLNSGLSVSWLVQARLLNDFEQPLGPWTTIGTETYGEHSVTPIRLSYDYTVTQGRYQVRLMRTDERTTGDGAAHDIHWIGLRATLSETGIDYDDATYIALKIRASSQLSGQLAVRVMSDRMLPVWDGAEWSEPQVTRNPAWALARVLQARGLSDDQIDLEQLLALATVWDQRQDRFDFAFDTRTTCWDALALIAKVGRAVPLIRGGKYTFWRDQQETTPVAAFSMRNIRRDSFRLTQALPASDPVDAIDLDYFDHRRWDWVTVTAQYHGGEFHGYRGKAERVALGLPAPTGPAKIKMPGIIGENQAIRTAVYHLADTVLRRRRARFSTELDGLLPAYGSLTVLQHDVGDFGQGGDAYDWDADTLTLQTTEPLAWVQGASHYVRLMRPDGVLSSQIAVTPGADVYSMVLASDPGFTLITDDSDRERTRYVFGDSDNMGALCRLRSIRPRSEREIELELVLEDDRVHEADIPWLAGGDEQDPIGDGSTPPASEDVLVNLVAGIGAGMQLIDIPAITASMTFHSDGRWTNSSEVTGVGTFEYSWPNVWLMPQPVVETVGARFEIAAWEISREGTGALSAVSVGLPLDGTYVDIGTDRTYSYYMPEPGLINIRVVIRDVETHTVMEDKTMVFYSVDLNAGGGDDGGGSGDGG